MDRQHGRLAGAWALLLALAWVLPASGCAHRYKFQTDLPASGERVSEWRHLAWWGYREVPPFDLEAACPEGVAEFGSYISFTNWLPAFFTLGLYAPRTVYAECAEPQVEAL